MSFSRQTAGVGWTKEGKAGFVDQTGACGDAVAEWGGNRPFAQLLSGLETGHQAAAGPSSACDFGVSDGQKAVFFFVSVLDFSECDSSGLDHLNSMWSNARVREYFRRKIGHSWTSRKPRFLNCKCAYIVTSHSTRAHRVYLRCLCDCSECDPSGLGLDSWNSSWIIAPLGRRP